jgi:hypothetical protein
MNEIINWFSNYLSIPKQSTATITFSIIVFILGLLINETIKEIGRFRQRRNYRRLFKRNYLQFKNYLFLQAANMESFSSQINENSNPNFNIYVSPCPAISNFKDISYSNAYKSLFTGIENLLRFKGNKGLQAFDELYNSLAIVQLEQERVFPILVNYQNEVKSLVENINFLTKEATENIGDVELKIEGSLKMTPELVKWLQDRAYIKQIFYGSDHTIEKMAEFLESLLAYEIHNGGPISEVFSLKEFWNYHHQLQLTVAEHIKLTRLFKTTKGYCDSTSERFKEMGHKLTSNYKSLFGEKLAG